MRAASALGRPSFAASARTSCCLFTRDSGLQEGQFGGAQYSDAFGRAASGVI